MKAVRGALTGFGMVLAAASAHAQTQPQEAAGQEADRTDALADIVVTATRRTETLQRVPVSVTAITASSLAGAGVGEYRDLTQVVPGFFGGRSLSLNQPVIRGVGSSGLSVGDESNVATYVDGIYQGDPYSTSMDLVEIERVEVLRGPQGTVFGRNATGGLVNVITPDPSYEARGRVAARYGRMRNDAGDYDLRAYLTGGLTDKLAADTAVLYRKNEAYADDLVRGGKLGTARFFNIRSKLMFEPSDSSKITLVGEYADYQSQDSMLQPLNGNSAAAALPGAIISSRPYNVAVGRKPELKYDRVALSLLTKFDLGVVALETSSGYIKSNDFQTADSDASNILLGETSGLIKPRVFSQEVRLLSNDSSRFDWTAGLYYFNLKGALDFTLVSPTSVTILGPRVTTDSYAAYAEGVYSVTDQLFVTLGGRYTSEKRSLIQNVNGVRLPFGKVKKSFDNFSYRGIVRYEFSPKANVYVSYSTAFKSGVFNGTSTSPKPVDPEKIRSLEGGIKADLASWLRTNISAYRYDYTDLQLTGRAADGLSFLLQNAASAEIYGGELEAIIAPTRSLTLRLAAAYTHADFKEFRNAQVYIPRPTGGNVTAERDVSGLQMPRAPRYTFNAGLEWETELSMGTLTLEGNVFHTARVFYDNLGLFGQKAYTMANGEVSLLMADEKLRLSVWARNITNVKALQQATPGALGTWVIYQKPRRVGVGLSYTF